MPPRAIIPLAVYEANLIILDGDGSVPPGDMFAKYPQTPGSESAPNTPVIVPSRRIRCKMCRYVDAFSKMHKDHVLKNDPYYLSRQELATREHMLDHGQLGPPTPALPSLSPVTSRRPSNDLPLTPLSRRPSASLNVTISRRPSTSQSRSRLNSGSNGVTEGRPAILAALGGRGLLESLSMSALETEDDADDKSDTDEPTTSSHESSSGSNSSSSTTAALKLPSRRPSGSDVRPFRPSPLSMEGIGRDLSHALEESMTSDTVDLLEGPTHRAPFPSVYAARRTSSPPPLALPTGGTQYASGADLAAQLSSNPKLAALRTAASLSMTSLNGSKVSLSPPILVNPKCSGYFVEPVCLSFPSHPFFSPRARMD